MATRSREVGGVQDWLTHSKCGSRNATCGIPDSPLRQLPNSDCRVRSSGYSLLELVVAVGLGVTLTAMATPNLLAGVDEYRTAGAAHYISARLQRARMEAVMRSRAVAVRFERAAGGRYAFAPYIDANRNGVLAVDIARGIDKRIGPAEFLTDRFAGVDFGTLPGLPAVEPGATPPGDDPIRLGPGSTATFTPLGTATAGSLYIRGRSAQYAIRIFGETGKTRVQRFNTSNRQWKPL
jgi:type II secretory pathway pseudopilin PulG